MDRFFTYDRDIICLPRSFRTPSGLIPIPRQRDKREFLAVNKLIGKIRLTSEMSEKCILKEIRSLFKLPMDDDSDFQFEFLQQSGGGSKSLNVPVISSTFKWTASAVCGKNSKTPIYILAKDKLKVLLLLCIAKKEMYLIPICR